MGFDVLNLSSVTGQVFGPLLGLLVVWDLFWKAVGLWYALKNNQRNWFIALFILNTVGILPIVYLKFYQKKQR